MHKHLSQLTATHTTEKQLYGAITRRLQAALEALEAEARAELGTNYPTQPKVVLDGSWQKLAGIVNNGNTTATPTAGTTGGSVPPKNEP
jgi:hypothetical protein